MRRQQYFNNLSTVEFSVSMFSSYSPGDDEGVTEDSELIRFRSFPVAIVVPLPMKKKCYIVSRRCGRKKGVDRKSVV